MGYGLYPTRDYASLALQGYRDVAQTTAAMTKKDSKQVTKTSQGGGGGGLFSGALGGAMGGAGVGMALELSAAAMPWAVGIGAALGALSYLF